MEKWIEICAQQAARLKRAQDVSRHVLALANHGMVSTWINPQDKEDIRQSVKDIQDKLPRLENAEFHIAVVGREKAGKSSFINAWLESDLLPSRRLRCTFTTTKLHSVKDNEPQVLKVTPKSRAEFEEMLQELNRLAASSDARTAQNAREDLDCIRENRPGLEELIGGDTLPFPFDNLDQIKDKLEQYAADPRYAHAISEINLHTRGLASMDGILFYDVPGIDSGLEKHVTETKNALNECDAVIMLKELLKPDLNAHEKEILRYVQQGNSTVPIKDKLFFFLSRIDDLKTPDGFKSSIREFKEKAAPYGLDERKISYGAAPVKLHLQGRLRNVEDIQPPDVLKKNLAMLLELQDDSDETVVKAAGIGDLKSRLNCYLETEREAILRESCDKIISRLKKAAYNIQSAVMSKVPDNPDEIRRRHNMDMMGKFSEWFGQEWERIMAALNSDESGALTEQSAKSMEEDYKEKAQSLIENLPHYNPEQREITFSAISTKKGGDELGDLNTGIREKLYAETVEILQELSAGLTNDLHGRLLQYIDNLSAYFHHSIPIQEEIYREMNVNSQEEYKRELQNALGALFLRYARPLAKGLIQYRHGSDLRKKEAESSARAYHSLSNFYPEEQPADFAKLPKYIRDGETVVDEPPKEDSTNNNDPSVRKYGIRPGSKMGGTNSDELQRGRPAGKMGYASREDVIEELEKDRDALRAYLVHTVFDCAGIKDYADAEIERIRRHFIKLEDRIQGKAMHAYQQHEPALMAMLPAELQQTECDVRISELLHQLSISLKDWTGAEY